MKKYILSKIRAHKNIRCYRGVIAAWQGDLDQELPDLDGGAVPLGLEGDVADSLEAAADAPDNSDDDDDNDDDI